LYKRWLASDAFKWYSHFEVASSALIHKNASDGSSQFAMLNKTASNYDKMQGRARSSKYLHIAVIFRGVRPGIYVVV